jgi:hypothetical protein
MLGWPEQFGQGGGGLWDGQDDREECVPVGTKADYALRGRRSGRAGLRLRPAAPSERQRPAARGSFAPRSIGAR